MRRTRRAITLSAPIMALAVAVLLSGTIGCGAAADPVQRDTLVLATTTSLQDSGLLDDVLLPAFADAQQDLKVKTIAVGSGEAMAMGARGEADVLLVHSPKDEEQFMRDGHGTLRLPVAYNFFAIVGPAKDPAGVRGAADATAAFAAIAESGATFASRGDDSGTNKKELALWASAGSKPAAEAYISSGQGMGETLQIASEKSAYTLTDLATFLAMKDRLDLVVLSSPSAELRNDYSVIIVNQNEFPTVNAAGAERFAAFLVDPATQKLIGAFGTDKYGQPLFFVESGRSGR
jgi:tungstate transport system substrate-binding protein